MKPTYELSLEKSLQKIREAILLSLTTFSATLDVLKNIYYQITNCRHKKINSQREIYFTRN